MPEAYERMRDKFISRGMSVKAAKAKAARNYNSQHPDEPVGPNYDDEEKRKKRRRKPKVSYPKPR